MDIAQLKKIRPHYDGLDDQTIVDLVHQNDYPDFSREDIASRLGVNLEQAKPAQERKLMSLTSGSAINDYVTEGVNAAIGGVSSIGKMVSPGNRVSAAMDRFVEDSQANLTDAARQGKEALSSELDQAQTIGDEVGAVLKYGAQNPGLAVSQAVGSIAVPGSVIKGVGKLSTLARMTQAGATRAAMGAGAVTGGAMAGGDAAGTAYDLVIKAGGTPEQATEAARSASVIPAAVGAAGGVVGAERLLAGAKGFAGNAVSRAAKTAAVEGTQEAVEEGVTQFEGQRAAVPYDPSIDPTKGVAGAAAMGGMLGAATGGGVALVSGDQGEQISRAPDPLAAKSAPGDVIRQQKTGSDGPIGRALDSGLEHDAQVVDAQVGKIAAMGGVAADAPAEDVNPYTGEIAPAAQVRQADAPAQALDQPLPTDIVNIEGKPFLTMRAAMNAVRDAGPDFEIKRVAGGLVVRAKEGATPQIPPQTGEGANQAAPLAIETPVAEQAIPNTKEKLSVEFGGKTYPVDSLQDAQAKWVKFEETAGAGVSQVGNGIEIKDQDGNVRGRISYNGRLWGAGGELVAEAPERSPVKQDDAQSYDATKDPFADKRAPAVLEREKAKQLTQRPELPAHQAGDILNAEGQPFKTKVPAIKRQKKDGGSIVQVQGGWVVRPNSTKEESNGNTGDTAAVSGGTGAGTSDQPSASMGVLRPAADGAQQLGGADPAGNAGTVERVEAGVTGPGNDGGAVGKEAKGEKPAYTSKEDLDHLFGVDKKRQAALDRIAKGTAYFGTREKASGFVIKSGIKSTHEVVETRPGRFEIRAKANLPAQSNGEVRKPAPTTQKPSMQDMAKDLGKVIKEGGWDAYTKLRNQFATDSNLSARETLDLNNLTRSVVGVEFFNTEYAKADPEKAGRVAHSNGEAPVAPAGLSKDQQERWLAGWDEGKARKDGQEPVVERQDGEVVAEASEVVEGNLLPSPDARGTIGAIERPYQKTVYVPEPVSRAIEGQMRKQKSRITRLRNEAEAAASLEEKKAAQMKVAAAEVTLRKMRTGIFDAEDAAVKAVEGGNAKAFANFADIFPDAAQEIAKLTGQNDELDAEMRSYERKAGPYARWRDSTPAQRRELLSAAGYTDGDQARGLSGTDWNQLTDAVRRALSADKAPKVSQQAQPVGRTYLVVPFSDKDYAKRFGAKWDEEKNLWYADPIDGGASAGEINTSLERYIPEDRIADDRYNYYGDKSYATAVAINAETKDGAKYEIVKRKHPDGMMMWSVMKQPVGATGEGAGGSRSTPDAPAPKKATSIADMTRAEMIQKGRDDYAAGVERQTGVKAAGYRFEEWLQGWNEAKSDAEAKESGKVATPSEFPLQEVSGSYSGISHSGSSRARSDRDAFVDRVQALYDEAKGLVITDAQQSALDKAIQIYKDEYIAQTLSLAKVRSGAYSAFVAGRAKLNTRQADSRNSALNKAIDRFTAWESGAAPKVKEAVLEARTPEEIAKEQAVKESAQAEKLEKRQKSELDLMRKILAVKGGSPLEIGGMVVTKVNNDKDGYPLTLTIKAKDGAVLTNDKISLATEIFGKRGIDGLRQGKEKIRALVDAIQTREDDAGNVAMFSLAYHGTPHRGIEKFSTDKIGTGEGAQAYGWGLYFASKREVAEHYRKGLSYREIVRQFRDALPDNADIDEALEAAENGELSKPMADVVKALAADDWLGFDYPAQAITAAFKDLDAYDPSPALQEAVRNYGGQLYKVEIPDDSEMLLWDKPLSEQPDKVQSAIEKFFSDNPSYEVQRFFEGAADDAYTGKDFYTNLKQAQTNIAPPNDARAASEALASLGVKGIKYLDGTSRSAGDGSYNYVIFSGDDVQVQEAMYKRAQTQSPGISLKSAQEIADQLEQSGLIKINVVQSVDDMPSDKRATVLSRVPDGGVRGVYFSGTDEVYVVAGNLSSPDEFTFVAMHEAFHRGLAKTIPGAKPLLNQIWRTNRKVKQLAAEQMERHGIGREEAIEEALADMAGKGEARDLSGWDAFLVHVKGWLSDLMAKIGVDIQWSDDMVADFVAGITRQGLRKGGVHVATGVPMASRGTNGAMPESTKPGPNGEQRTGTDQGNAVTASKQIAEAIVKDDDAGAVYGIRVIPGDFSDELNAGDSLPPSNQWIDGEDSGQPMTGTSAVRINGSGSSDVLRALKLAGADGNSGPNGFYWGDRVALVKGESAGSGEDVGEVLLKNATIVNVWKKPTKGKSSVLPNADASKPTFNTQEGDYNPDIPKYWINVAKREAGNDPDWSEAEYHQNIAEYANQYRVEEILEKLGFKSRGASNISSSKYLEKDVGTGTFDEYDIEDTKTFEVRISDHDDYHPNTMAEKRFQVAFRFGDASWADLVIDPDMSTADAEKALRDLFSDDNILNDQSAPDSGGAMLSRSTITKAAQNAALDIAGSAGKKIGFIDKTLATQYAKAQRFPQFKRVFDKVQEYIGGISTFANQAADKAPDILPKLETWKDLKRDGWGSLLRHGLSKEDSQALAGPVFEGTLNWVRDESGKLVKQEVMEAKAGEMSAEDKARQMLRAGKLSEQVMKMWQGLPVEQFQTMVDNKYERDMLKAGVVFKDAELKSLYGMSPKQISHYRQFRASVDESLDQVAATEVVRLLGKNATKDIKAMAETAQGRAQMRDAVENLLDDDPDNADLWNAIADKFNKVADLKARGYAPLTRFGKFYVHVVDSTGQTQYFGLEETKMAANRLARQLRSEYPKSDVLQGLISQERYKLLSQVPIDAMELFAGAIGADKSEVFQKYIQLAKNNRSTMKRLLRRKGTAGFSMDAPRVLASFVTSNARAASAAMHVAEAKESAQGIFDGDVQDEAVKLVESVTDPVDTAAKIRGLMFVNFIGGSLASAVVNLTQPVTMTLPYLSQWGGIAKAGARLTNAAAMAAGGVIKDQDLRRAMKVAQDNGTIEPQEIHHLMRQASDGVLKDNAAGAALQKLAFMWGTPFSLAEQFNRKTSFIAAYLTAKEQGIANPQAFAEKAVVETQGLYNTGNRMNWSRNPVGAVVLTFKQFSVHYLEWLARMYQSGPDGKKAAAWAIAILIMAAGTDGLPFMGDLDDIIDTLGQSLGFDTNSKRARREWAQENLGEWAAPIFNRGFSAAAGFPVDVSVRMGMGNLLPATDLLLQSNQDTGRSVAEIAGAGGGLFEQYKEASKRLLSGDAGGALLAASPVAIRNLGKGIEMANTGEFRDQKDRKVDDADMVDAGVKALGFQPARIAAESAMMSEQRRSEQLAKTVESEIVEDMARAIADDDQEKQAKAKARLDDWNENNPEMPIRITKMQIRQKVRSMMQSRQERYLKTVAPERRQAAAAEFQP